MNYGKLYDEQVADTYDLDKFGLLSGLRAIAIAQVLATPVPPEATCLDLGAGTGEGLVALRDRLPGGRFIGIDLSERMLAIARKKLPVETFVDDALHANAHVPDGSVDLALAHFVTSYVDRSQLFAVARRTLRPGGVFSVASTTREGLGRIRDTATRFLGDNVLDSAAPAPANDGTMEREIAAAGFEVVASETYTRAVSFGTFDECLTWGLQSGFFTQIVSMLGPMKVAMLRPLASPLFPFHDEYMGIAVTAVATDRR